MFETLSTDGVFLFTTSNMSLPYISSACLEPAASETVIRKLCEQAWLQRVGSICVAPSYVAYAVEMLEFCPTKIGISTVIGFPFGYNTTQTKLAEAACALEDGADELEVTLNVSRFKSMAYLSIREELRQLAELAHTGNALLTVCVETGLLDSFDLYTALEICAESGADFVKTASGFFSADHSPEAIRQIRGILAANIRLSVFTKEHSDENFRQLLEAGADRICVPFAGA